MKKPTWKTGSSSATTPKWPAHSAITMPHVSHTPLLFDVPYSGKRYVEPILLHTKMLFQSLIKGPIMMSNVQTKDVHNEVNYNQQSKKSRK